CYSLHCFFQAEDGIRDRNVTGVQTCALPIYRSLPRYCPQRSCLFIAVVRLRGIVACVPTIPYGRHGLRGTDVFGSTQPRTSSPRGSTGAPLRSRRTCEAVHSRGRIYLVPFDAL